MNGSAGVNSEAAEGSGDVVYVASAVVACLNTSGYRTSAGAEGEESLVDLTQS